MSLLAWALRLCGVSIIAVSIGFALRLAPQADQVVRVKGVTRDKYSAKPLRISKRGAYDLIYLGAFGGRMQPYHGGSMNGRGDVCGAIQPDVTGVRIPFWMPREGTPKLLQIDGRSVPGRATAINDRDQVVGDIDGDRAFLWDGETVRKLPPPPGFATSEATSISPNGTVAGFACTPGKDEYWRWKAVACLWKDGKPIPLPLPEGCFASRASGINAAGLVVGNAITKGGKSRAFLYDGKGSRLLPLLPGGTLSSATGINAKGQIAGDGDRSPSWTKELPFDVRPVLWEGMRVRDLGLPRGYRYAKATAINDRGHVGITAQLLHWDMSDYDFYKAFVWSPEKGLVRLNTLVDPGFGHHLSKVYALNNGDEVLAQGRFLGRPWELLEPFYVLVPHRGE